VNVNVHIARLVLHGLDLPPRERARLENAFRSELTLLVGNEHACAPAWSSTLVPSTPVQTVRLPSATDGASVGRRVARAVHAAIGGTT
jgi:hypothetical protein